jgi:hypothetical protein
MITDTTCWSVLLHTFKRAMSGEASIMVFRFLSAFSSLGRRICCKGRGFRRGRGRGVHRDNGAFVDRFHAEECFFSYIRTSEALSRSVHHVFTNFLCFDFFIVSVFLGVILRAQRGRIK